MRFVISKVIYLGHLEIFKMLCPPKKLCESSTRTGYKFFYFCFNHCQGTWYVVSEHCPTKVLYIEIHYIFSPALFSCRSSFFSRIGLSFSKKSYIFLSILLQLIKFRRSHSYFNIRPQGYSPLEALTEEGPGRWQKLSCTHVTYVSFGDTQFIHQHKGTKL